MVQGALFAPGFWPGRLSRRWYATRPGSIGQEGGGGRSLGLCCARRSPLICARRSSAVSGGREPACRACRAVARWYSVNRDTLTRPGPGRPPGRRAGGCGAQSLYMKVRSVFCDRAEPVRAQQVAVARPADSAGLYRPDNLSCRPGARPRTGAGTPAPATTLPIVWSSAIWQSRIARKSPTGPVQHGRSSTASRPKSRPAGGVLPGA